MIQGRNRLAAGALLVLLGAVAQAETSQRRGDFADEGGVRAELLADIASVAGGVFLDGRPGLDYVRVSGVDVDEFLKALGHGSSEVTRTRVFLGGRLVPGAEQSLPGVIRESGIYDPATGTLYVVGTIGQETVIEDIRTLSAEGAVFLLRDIHLNGSVGAVATARSIPVLLTSSKALAPPQVSSISGVTSSAAGISNGRVDMSCGTTWNGSLVINDQTGVYPWTLNGLNFGSTAGTVTVGDRIAAVTSWTSTRIVANPTSSPSWGPATTLVKIAASTGSSTFGVGFAPSIRSRIYGQCTHWVAYKRLSMGLQPSLTAYGNYTTITAQWVPRSGDQLQWSGHHTAIVTGVSGPVSGTGGYKTYTLTISERNADCRNTIHTYQTEFQTRTVSGVTTITKYPKSSVTSLGSSTTYYR